MYRQKFILFENSDHFVRDSERLALAFFRYRPLLYVTSVGYIQLDSESVAAQFISLIENSIPWNVIVPFHFEQHRETCV